MENLNLILYALGLFLIIVSVIFQFKKISITTQVLTIFLFGIALCLIPVLKPTLIKIGDIQFELNQIKQVIKPFAIVDLKNRKVEYSTLKKTKIISIDSTFTPDAGEVVITLNQKPMFIRYDFNGIGNYGSTYEDAYFKSGNYIVHINFIKYSYKNQDVKTIKSPEKMILEIIGDGDL